jgi:hypothetical protein
MERLNLENALKTHFQLQNTYTKKSKKTDLRPLFDGQIISTEGVTENLKQLESEKQEKELEKATKKSKQLTKKMDFDGVDNDQVSKIQDENLKKCSKCKSLSSENIFLCENTTCKNWFCRECLPKRFKIGSISIIVQVNQKDFTSCLR